MTDLIESMEVFCIFLKCGHVFIVMTYCSLPCTIILFKFCIKISAMESLNPFVFDFKRRIDCENKFIAAFQKLLTYSIMRRYKYIIAVLR